MQLKLTVTLVLCLFGAAEKAAAQTSPYQDIVAQRLPLFGHRNWIVIADSAYPAQAAPGIETVYTGQQQLEVVAQILDAVSAAPHVRPVVHIDKELEFVDERHAKGISDYRKALKGLLADHHPKSLPHEEIIASLDEAGKRFRVLILKTDLTLPYTSVFIQLDAGYWSAAAEAALRERMKAKP